MRAEAGLTPRSAPGNGSAAGDDAGMDRAKGRSRERGEDAGCAASDSGIPLPPASRPDEREYRPGKSPHRRAHRRAAVAARDINRLVGGSSVSGRQHLASDGVDVTYCATQPDGRTQPPAATAVAKPGHSRPVGTLEQLGVEGTAITRSSIPSSPRRAQGQRRRGHARRPLAVSSALAGMARLLSGGSGRELPGFGCFRPGRGAVLRQRRGPRSRAC